MRVRLNQQRLLAFLAQSRLSQNHWALKLGLSRGHWSEIVNGKHPRTVAVKVISPEAVSGIGVTQFLREIATVAHLQHPHLLPLFDSGEVAGHPFYVMPYIRGGSLRARLNSAIRLPIDEAVALITGIAAALQHAHEHRILHCDVKPENILLDGGHPYVMDFGVAPTCTAWPA